MKYEQIEQWSKAMDEAEDALKDHSVPDMPDIPLGSKWTDPENRTWAKVMIAYGATGGRWCYKQSDFVVIVDSIFNGWSDRFAGMLMIPYDGKVMESLMMVRDEA